VSIYPTAGFGDRYENLLMLGGDDIEMSLWMIEGSIPVSLRIIDGLSIAVSWRMTYIANSSKNMPVQIPGQSPTFSNMDLSGFNASGYSIGINFSPVDWIQLGLCYRSALSTRLEGTYKIQQLEDDATTDFNAPDSIRLGAALWLLDKKLMLALDIKYLAYSQSNRKMPSTMTMPNGEQVETIMDLNWQDVKGIHMGIEYYLNPYMPIRLGYSLCNSATPKSVVNAFVTAPGSLHSIHAGVGLNFSLINIDLGGFYTFNTGGEVTDSDATSSPLITGNYALRSILIALSGSIAF
jgi:long-subunit fatty acid transport protein